MSEDKALGIAKQDALSGRKYLPDYDNLEIISSDVILTDYGGLLSKYPRIYHQDSSFNETYNSTKYTHEKVYIVRVNMGFGSIIYIIDAKSENIIFTDWEQNIKNIS